MKAMQSFLTFFYLLDQGYDEHKKDDLGGFLGAISPEIWEDGKAIDIAIFNDWQNISKPDTVDESNIIKKTYDFLNYYEKTFNYNFSETKKWLTTVTDETVEKAYNKAEIMCYKFQ